MSRFVYPTKFEGQLTLFRNIKKKHDADGPASILIYFFSENEIDISADAATTDSAEAIHDEFRQKSRTQEMLRELRDIKIAKPWKHLKQCTAFLKALYPTDTRKLGDWGLTVNRKNAIAYPRKFSQRAQLVIDFIAKHNSYAPGSSPLQIFLDENSIDLAADLVLVNDASVQHNLFDTASKEKEALREQRDVIWKPVWSNVRGTCSYLKTIFNANAHRAGDYGITVDSAPKKMRKIKSTLLTGKSAVFKSFVIGSVFSNHGNAAIHLYKGRKTSAQPLVISSKQEIELPKGFSTATVHNPSESEKAIFTAFYKK